MAGVTLDTGVLIALERRQRRALALWAEWTRSMVTLTVPAVAIAEWWRDRQWDAARWLGGVDVEPVDEALARIAPTVTATNRGAAAPTATATSSAKPATTATPLRPAWPGDNGDDTEPLCK